MNKKFTTIYLALALLCTATVGTYAAVPVKKDLIKAARQAAKAARELARKTQPRVPRNHANDHVPILIDRPLSFPYYPADVPKLVEELKAASEQAASRGAYCAAGGGVGGDDDVDYNNVFWRDSYFRRVLYDVAKKPTLENGRHRTNIVETFDGVTGMNVIKTVIANSRGKETTRPSSWFDLAEQQMYTMYLQLFNTPESWDMAELYSEKKIYPYTLYGPWSVSLEEINQIPAISYLFHTLSFSEYIVKNSLNFPFFKENPTLDRYILHLWNGIVTKQIPDKCGEFLLFTYLDSLNAADVEETLLTAEEFVNRIGHLPGIRYFAHPNPNSNYLQALTTEIAEEISLGMPTVLILRYLDRTPVWEELSPSTKARVTALQIQLAQDVQRLLM